MKRTNQLDSIYLYYNFYSDIKTKKAKHTNKNPKQTKNATQKKGFQKENWRKAFPGDSSPWKTDLINELNTCFALKHIFIPYSSENLHLHYTGIQ